MARDLTVIVKASDQFTGPLVRAGAAFGGWFLKVQGGAQKAAGGLGALSSRVLAIGGALTGLAGLGGAYGALSAVERVSRDLDHLNDVAVQTGLSRQMLSELGYVAETSGVGFDELAQGLGAAQKNAAEFARTGGGKAADAFRRLGVEVGDGSGKVREINGLVEDLFDALSGVADESERVEIASKIFGTGGASLLRFASEGAARLRLMRQEARALNVSFSDRQVDIAAKYRDAIDRIRFAFKGLVADVLEKVGPTLTEWGNSLAQAIASVPDILGHVLGVLRSNDESVKQELESLGAWITLFATDLSKGLVFVVVGGIRDGFSLVLSAVWGELKVLGLKLILAVGEGFAGGFESLGLEDLAFKFRDGMAELREQLGDEGKTTGQMFVDGLKSAWTDLRGGSALQAAAEEMQGSLRFSLNEIVGAGDRLFKVSESFKAHAGVVATLGDAYARAREGAEKSMGAFAQMGEGIVAEIRTLVTQAKDFTAVGRDMAQTLGQAFTGGLAAAILDVADGTKSLKAAFTDWFASTLRQISMIATQFLLLRAVAGVFGGLLTPSMPEFSGFLPPSATLPVVSVPPGFAGGGVIGGVPMGPATRDNTLIRAMVGESVLTRDATRRLGSRGVAELNSGRTPSGLSGVHIEVAAGAVVLHVHGSGVDPKGLARELHGAVVDAVASAVLRDPGFRAHLRRA